MAISVKSTDFTVTLGVLPARMRVVWSVRQHESIEIQDTQGRVTQKRRKETVFWPSVTEKEPRFQEIPNPEVLRSELFRAYKRGLTEDTALSLLNRVGAWELDSDSGPHRLSWPRETVCESLVYRHRYYEAARVVPVTIEDLQRDIEHWYGMLKLLNQPSKLRKHLKSAPSAESEPYEIFGYAFESTRYKSLDISLEWSGKHPRAVVAPMSGLELLRAFWWADVLAGAGSFVCANPTCNVRFSSSRKRKYCPAGDCAHAVAQRQYRLRQSR